MKSSSQLYSFLKCTLLYIQTTRCYLEQRCQDILSWLVQMKYITMEAGDNSTYSVTPLGTATLKGCEITRTEHLERDISLSMLNSSSTRHIQWQSSLTLKYVQMCPVTVHLSINVSIVDFLFRLHSNWQRPLDTTRFTQQPAVPCAGYWPALVISLYIRWPELFYSTKLDEILWKCMLNHVR